VSELGCGSHGIHGRHGVYANDRRGLPRMLAKERRWEIVDKRLRAVPA